MTLSYVTNVLRMRNALYLNLVVFRTGYVLQTPAVAKLIKIILSQFMTLMVHNLRSATHVHSEPEKSSTAPKIFAFILTPCSRAILENLTGSQLVKKFPAFYRTQRFITAFTRARHLSLSWASSIQSTSQFLKIHLNIIFPSMPGSSKSSLSLSSPPKTPIISPIRATRPAHLIRLDLITRTILSEQYRSLTFRRLTSTIGVVPHR